MYCYYIIHKETNFKETIYGYSFIDACKRNKLNPADWIIFTYEYID